MAASKNTIRKKNFGHTVAFFIIGFLLLFITVMLPIVAASIYLEVFQQRNIVYELSSLATLPKEYTAIHIDLLSTNEWEETITLRITGHDSCSEDCSWNDRILFVSLLEEKNRLGEVEPSEAILIPAGARDITENISLPFHGDPLTYPFDSYSMGLGIIMERVYPDGKVYRLTPEETKKELVVTLQPRLPRLAMDTPVLISNLKKHIYGNLDEEYPYAQRLSFTRPLYMQILTVLLVLLVTLAAAYAIFMRPFNELVISSGALVLGVWGIRAILLGANLPGFTLVDIALAVVILFLLIALTIRALHYLYIQSGLTLFKRQGKRKKIYFEDVFWLALRRAPKGK